MGEFLAASRVEVERLTKNGPRRMDARAAVISMELDRRADAARRMSVGYFEWLFGILHLPYDPTTFWPR